MTRSILTVTVAATTRRLALEADLRTELGSPPEPLAARVSDVLDQACADVEAHCGRIFARETVQEIFRLDGTTAEIILARYPVASVTSVTEDGVALSAGDYETDTVAGIIHRLEDDGRVPWTARKVTIVYVAGYLLPGQDGANLPADITRATLIVATAMFEAIGRDATIRSESVDGVASTSYLDPRAGQGGMPPLAVERLSRYREQRV